MKGLSGRNRPPSVTFQVSHEKFADPEVRGVRGVFVGVFWKAWCGNGEQDKVTLADSSTSAQPQPFYPISVRLLSKTNIFT